VAYPYRVFPDDERRAALRTLVGSGAAPARTLTRARVLLKADHGAGGPGWADAAIAGALDLHPCTVQRIRRRFVAEGLDATLARKRPDRVYPRALDGRQEAHLVALACARAPAGHARWSLRLLADELARLEVAEAVSHETVRRTPKKTSSSRG
jgi:transposase